MSFLFPSTTITFDAAMRDLASGSPKARAFAAHALGELSDPVERRRAVDALIRALDDDRAEVRAEACSSLGELGEPGALPHLIKRLDDGITAVRQNAAIALGTMRHPDGFEPLAVALRSGPPDLRFQAATSLAEIDGPRAFDLLVAALGDADPLVVGAAALSLGSTADPRAIAVLTPLLSHKDPAARFDVAYALAELKNPAGRDHLVAALADPDRAWDAVDALGWLATRDDAEALGRSLSDRKMPAEAQVSAAGTALRIDPGGVHHDAARRALIDALGSRKEYVRSLAVDQLGAVGGAWAKAPLEKLARSGKGVDLLEAIADALRTIEGRKAP